MSITFLHSTLCAIGGRLLEFPRDAPPIAVVSPIIIIVRTSTRRLSGFCGPGGVNDKYTTRGIRRVYQLGY